MKRRSRYGVRLLALAAGPFLAGCATTVTPAAPVAHASPSPARPAPFNGEYDATFYTPWVGPLHARIIAEPTADGFKANTPPGVAWTLVGGLQGFLGQIFAPFVFPSGMILTWTSTLPEGDTPGEGSIGVGTLSSLRVRTRLTAPGRPFELLFKEERSVGLVTLTPAGPGPIAHADYVAMADRAAAEIPRRFYDPALGDSPQARQFITDLRAGAARAGDDAEFLFAMAIAARKSLRQNPPLLYPLPDAAPLPPALAEALADARPWRLDTADDGIPCLHFDAITGEDSVDDALAEALAHDPPGLIIDLRNCAGVDAAALYAASRFLSAPADAGVVFASPARARVLAGSPPDAPSLVIAARGDCARFDSEIEQSSLARVRVEPGPGVFSGPVAVLTSRRTSSTAEWFVWVMKSSGRARIFGEPTAGRPVLSEEFDVGQNWVLRLPAIDWRAPGQSDAADTAISPHELTTKGGAEEAARRWLLPKSN